MFSECFAVGNPDSTVKLAVNAQNQQLVQREVFPRMRERQRENERENRKGFGPAGNIIDPTPLLLRRRG